MSDRAEFRVCSKAALFSPDLKKVLAIDLREWGLGYGMPGGHLEAGEEPDEAIRRELREELNLVEEIALHRVDFFSYKSEDKIVLGYAGVVTPSSIDTAFDSGEGRPIWLAIKDIDRRRVELGSYRAFVLKSKDTLALFSTLEN